MARAAPLSLALLLLSASAAGQPAVPERKIPPSVLAELREIEDRFEAALAQDCAPERCFPKGCSYGEHTVADQPRKTALPGLAEEQGPGSGPSQAYLTLARCAFAYEKDMSNRDAAVLARRLRTKLSTGWTVVQVSRQRLPELPSELREPPAPPEPPEPAPVEEEVAEPAPPPPPVAWEPAVALRELWVSLLPHFSWMIAVVMLTVAALLLIWGWRRLGRLSPEEQVLLSQMGPAEAATPAEAEPAEAEAPAEADDDDSVEAQRAYWQRRLGEDAEPDPDVRALVASWLEARQMGLLAKAVLTYPETLPAAFPDGGRYAQAKLEFSEYLRDVKGEDLPSDREFYERLKQHALSAALARHSDASAVHSLRADFGAGGLVRTVEALPPRHGALLFAHASLEDQLEASRVLSQAQLADLSEQLLRSNRMSRSEAAYLLELLEASQEDRPLPEPPARADVSDLGATFDAASALSILLPRVEPGERKNLLDDAKDRFGGSFPGWFSDIVYADVLLALGEEARADLLLEPDAQNLAGWLSLIPSANREALMAGMSASLRAALQASAAFPSREAQLERYRRGRVELAEALQRQLARYQLPFEQVMV